MFTPISVSGDLLINLWKKQLRLTQGRLDKLLAEGVEDADTERAVAILNRAVGRNVARIIGIPETFEPAALDPIDRYAISEPHAAPKPEEAVFVHLASEDTLGEKPDIIIV